MNSKGEFNRCTIHRLDTRSEKVKLKESVESEMNENKLKKVILEMQKKKRERSKENKRRTREMKEALVEISNENLTKWKKRRKLESIERKKIDELGVESLERWRKRNKCIEERRKCRSSLKEKGIISEKKPLDWIKMKKDYWRKHRVSCEISPIDGDTCFGNEIECRADELEKSIIEIGKSVKFRLKKSVFKESFADLEKKDYLRDFKDSRENLSISEKSLDKSLDSTTQSRGENSSKPEISSPLTDRESKCLKELNRESGVKTLTTQRFVSAQLLRTLTTQIPPPLYPRINA